MVEVTGPWPTLEAAEGAVRTALASARQRPFVVGLCGSQGSGKSTLAEALAERLDASGHKTALLSIDDLYLTKQARMRLAREIHPLLRTRGVPGTHDVALGLSALAALDRGQAAPLPRFDKAIDDRMPQDDWGLADADTAVVIFEGWCVAAVPQPVELLARPINSLESQEDDAGVWRAYVNRRLAGDYQQLFARIDFLILLAAPGFEIVREWRLQQEHALRIRAGTLASGVMSDDEVSRFVQHYERLTRHILSEMPARADLVIQLDVQRHATAIRHRKGHRVAPDQSAQMLQRQQIQQ